MDTDRERMEKRREELRQQRVADTPVDKPGGGVGAVRRKPLARCVFSETVNLWTQLSGTPAEWKEQFDKSDRGDWAKWIRYDAVTMPSKYVLDTVSPDEVLPTRKLRTDKNEATRGDRSYEENPLLAKTRNIVPGYKDKQLLSGELKTNAPTITDAATSVILQETASREGWDLQQGYVDSAFLNGKYLSPDRRVFFRAPKGGLPAVPELGWGFIPEGTILQAKNGVYGTNDAPLLWYDEHKDTILSLPGASRSKLCPALFIFHDKDGNVIGLIGTHVDDDLIAGPKGFFANQVGKLQNMHVDGKWQYVDDGFHHCGRYLRRNQNREITCSQKDHTASIEKAPVNNERRKQKDSNLTPEERQALHSGYGQIQWLVKSTRMDLAFQLAEARHVLMTKRAPCRTSSTSSRCLATRRRTMSRSSTGRLTWITQQWWRSTIRASPAWGRTKPRARRA
ncbi:hypothetical protein N9L68_04025 [bacterium]|nr:hypothetical protein [bacterium]